MIEVLAQATDQVTQAATQPGGILEVSKVDLDV